MRVRIREDFTGFPDGTDGSKTHYRAGQTLDLDEDFAKLINQKGHAVPHGVPQSAENGSMNKNDDQEKNDST
ncbi:hypothetical protein [Lichenifustis flavocetrariae]|uniref:Uncharacterized protein n=1 Tax=Lichenifustis flavocetrariae TaxID=2949735 RepID=A0AA41YZ83_9HYPH|nr:hypothetical protein [Lichenifustis flavocetrariae]MCW6509823.1 hypothetical protein [Lichenifustis flavocetrariae]